jgi:hypothetical protein
MGRMRRLPLLVLGAAGLALWTGPVAAPAGASCILSATYDGAPFVGTGFVPGDQVAGPVGPGSLPACNDTPGTPIVAEATPVTLHRVRGVAPRFGVALPSASGRAGLLVVAENPCIARPAARALACLRRMTRELLEGPSLIADVAARAGSVVEIGVNIRDARVRLKALTGIDALLQRRVDGRWRSLFHLQHPLPDTGGIPAPVLVGTPGYAVPAIGLIPGRSHPVRLPDVEAGQYRLAQEVSLNGRERWVTAVITILPPAPPPSCTNCPHG